MLTIPWKRLFIGIVFGVIVFAAFGIYGDISKIKDSLSKFNFLLIIPVLLLSLLNYFLRFLKWAYFLKKLEISCNLKTSLEIFLSGFAMGITPGKVGELLKAYLLKVSSDVPLAKGIPVIISDRISDMLALILLCVIGIYGKKTGIDIIITGLILTLAVIVILKSRSVINLLANVAGRWMKKKTMLSSLENFYSFQEQLLNIKPVFITTVLSVFAWFSEAVGCYITAAGFDIESLTIQNATFIYTLATLAGAASMIPGGLIAAEGSMIFLLMSEFGGVQSLSIAISISLILRVCTFWFAVLLGIIGLILMKVNGACPQFGENKTSKCSSGL